IPSLAITPSLGRKDAYDLTPTSVIGTVRLTNLAIEIRPKLPIDRVLFMLSYAIDPRRWRTTPFDYQEQDSVVEAIVPGFVSHIKNAFLPGILHGYRTVEEAIPGVRGRLRFDEQVRRRFGIAPPLEVHYDDFTEDIEENRLLKAAITRLGH